MEEENIEGANKEFNDELTNLIDSMSGANFEHESTLNVCYAEYFDHKVKEFEQIEKQIGLFIQSFSSNAKDSQEIKTAGDVNKEREELLFHIRESFDSTKVDGFGIDRHYKPIIESNNNNNQTTAAVQGSTKSTSDGDNFCDFILKDIDNCDNRITMMGYGAATSEHGLSNNLNSPELEKSEIGELTFRKDDTDSYETFPSYLDSSIPPRLRFKRHFTLMTKPVPVDTVDLYPNEMEVKRRRTMQIRNNI